MTEQQIHHQTRRGADLAIARKQISQESHTAVLAGTLSLDDAKELGRDRGPHGEPVGSRISKDTGEGRAPCLCGCGEIPRSKTAAFVQGHDPRMVTLAKSYVRGEAEPTEEQMEYLESSGKLQRARDRVAEEDRREQERIAAKTEKQRKREGAVEDAKRQQQSE